MHGVTSREAQLDLINVNCGWWHLSPPELSHMAVSHSHYLLQIVAPCRFTFVTGTFADIRAHAYRNNSSERGSYTPFSREDVR